MRLATAILFSALCVALTACGTNASSAGSASVGGDVYPDGSADGDPSGLDGGSADAGGGDSVGADDGGGSDGGGTDGGAADGSADALADGIGLDGAINFPDVIVAVETRLSAREVEAGSSVYVRCDAIDEDGEIVPLPEEATVSWVVAPSNSMIRGDEPAEFIAARAGAATVACTLPSLSLIDDTPADLTIRPGPPHTILTQLDQLVIVAGETVTASCEAYDVMGNFIPDAEMEILLDPFGDGVSIFDTRIIITRSGLYDVTCSADGAEVLVGELLEVTPSLPADLAVGVTPDRAIYGIGDVVSLIWTVTDEYGNLVENPPVSFASVPSVPSFGEGRYRFDREGIFRLTVFIGRPTASGEPLVGFVELVVNGVGPTIGCDYPAFGEMIHAAPGSTVFFEGVVSDEFGVDRVLVNGVEAFIRRDSTFVLEMPVELGVNFVEIEAFDTLGASNSRNCTFLAADNWGQERGFLDNDIALILTQDAFDDGVRGDGLDSLNDIVWTVLNAPELRDQIDRALQDANPLYPTTCVLDSWFGCIVRVGVSYRYLRLGGPQDSSLSLVDDGLRIAVTVRGIEVGLRVHGTFGTSGNVELSRLGLDMTFNITQSGGRPRVTLRGLNRVDVGSLDSDFSGITGFVLDIIVDIFEDTIRDMIRDQIRDFVQDEINAILDDTLSSLDIESLGDSFEVPRLDGGDPIEVGFGVHFSTIAVNTARALFAMGSRFTGPTMHGGPSLGTLIPPGHVLDDSPPDRTVKASIALALLNQVLHTLWRAAMFDATIGGDTLSDGIPEDAAATLYANLPPVVIGTTDDGLALQFGGLRANVSYPGILAEPINVTLGAEVVTGVDLVGEDVLHFRDIVLTRFFFDPVGSSIDASTRDTLEVFLRETIQYVLDESLNSALPALPIPVFELPDSISEYGLPGGASFGLLSPLLSISDTHFVLQGNFGTR